MRPPISITEVIDGVALSRFQKRSLAICLALCFADGFNVLSIGYAIPSLAESYQVSAADFWVVVTADLVGQILSNFLIAPLADRFGRKRMVVIGILIFGFAAVPAYFATTITVLAACRFVGGLGIGAAVPNGFALGNEYSPTRIKATVVTLLSSGTAVGGLIVGIIASQIVPIFGGEMLLLVAGIVPLVTLAVTWRSLPESIEYLAKTGQSEKVGPILESINNGHTYPVGTNYVLPAQPVGTPVRALFRDGRAVRTLLLWSMMFFALFGSYFVLSWLATILTDNGIGASTALLATSFATLGGIVGSIFIGITMDRSRFGTATAVIAPIVSIASILALVSSFAPDTSGRLIPILCFFLGFGTIGLAAALTSVAAQAYPTSVRATGIGWAFGVSRFGGLFAPALGGALLASNMTSSSVLLVSIIPAAIAGILVITYQIFAHRGASPQPTSAEAEITTLSAPDDKLLASPRFNSGPK